MPAKGPKYLSTKQVADILGVSPVTLRRWRSEKKGPKYSKLGTGHCRYKPSDIKRWLEGDEQKNG